MPHQRKRRLELGVSLAKPWKYMGGDTHKVYDAVSGRNIPTYILVAVLLCSLYGYAEDFSDMKSNHWIEAYTHTYSCFGSVARILHLHQGA